MYQDEDVDSAVEAGVLTPQLAAAFRAHVAARRQTPAQDEEHFRFFTGFNDVFLALACTLVLIVPVWSLPGLTAALAWGIAEYVTRVRRRALPSIVLLLFFSAGTFFQVRGIASDLYFPRASPPDGASAIAAASVLFATALHWLRFRVPMTPAVWALSGLGTILFALEAMLPERDLTWPLLGLGGLATFGYAMYWDVSDRERRTRRADVAFWLHLLAAPLIAHSAFRLLGIFDSGGPDQAPWVLILYVFFGLIALAVDRRAILVSGLVYAVAAVSTLTTGPGGDGILLGMLLLGASLLLLGLFWTPVRGALLRYVPEAWRRALPPAVDRG